MSQAKKENPQGPGLLAPAPAKKAGARPKVLLYNPRAECFTMPRGALAGAHTWTRNGMKWFLSTAARRRTLLS
jgi:hypothetical protein